MSNEKEVLTEEELKEIHGGKQDEIMAKYGKKVAELVQKVDNKKNKDGNK